jgi:hypothetical protein
MRTISELIGRTIEPTGKVRQPPKVQALLSCASSANLTSPSRIYELEAFNYLFENSRKLDIESVIKFDNLHVDGQIVLVDRRRFVIEVKYRMNWLKQCQAVWQFKKFLSTKEAETNPVSGAIIIFEEFTADWSKKANSHAKNLWGWEGWYLEVYNCIPEKPMHLLMWRQGGDLRGYPCFSLSHAVHNQLANNHLFGGSVQGAQTAPHCPTS